MKPSIPTTCRRLRERLPEYAEGKLRGTPAAAVARHVAGCARCQAEVAELRALLTALHTWPAEEVPEHLAPRVSRAVAAQAAPRARPVWSRLALPMAAATGALALLVTLHSVEEGWEPRSAGLRQSLATRDRMEEFDGRGSAPRRSGPDRVSAAPESRAVGSPPVDHARRHGGGEGRKVERAPSRERGTFGLDQYEERGPVAKVSGGQGEAGEVRGETTSEMTRKAPGTLSVEARPAPPAAMAKERGNKSITDASVPVATGPAGPAGGGGRMSRRAAEASGSRRASGREGGWSRPRGGDDALAPSNLLRQGNYHFDEPAERSPVVGGRGGAGARLGEIAGAQAPVAALRPQVMVHREGERALVSLRLTPVGPPVEARVAVGGQEQWKAVSAEPVTLELPYTTQPRALPIEVAVGGRTHSYMLYLPDLSRLGQFQGGAEARRYQGAPLAKALREVSSRTGVIILAEGPLEEKVTADLSLASPRAALETLAKFGGYEVRAEGMFSFSLLARPAG